MASSILTAAIDFGTTYSGCAYSFEHQYKQDPTKVFVKLWSGGMLMSDKAPTAVLIAPDGKTFKAFGYEAEDKYAELALEKEHNKWFYFRRFKMLLMDKIGLERGFQMEDETGKKLLAKTVFSMAIKYLKNTLLEECKTRIAGMILSDDIMWVLTVPAIWNDSAKQFMREAAVEAGINTEKLKLALEPEAASLFCRRLPIDIMTGDTDISKIQAGSKYMVLDAGGGTVDITVHQVLQEGSLKEVHDASGGAWGGTNVDEAFMQLIISFVGNPVLQKFREEYMDDYLDMTRDFEIKKRKVAPEPDSNDKKNENEKKFHIVIRFPLTLKKLFEKETGEDLQTCIEQTRHAGQVELKRDKLKVNERIMRSFFRRTNTKNCRPCEFVVHQT